MIVDGIFEYATRAKLRFPYKGQVSVEDLWDLSVRELDQIFKTLNSQYRGSQQEESLLKDSSSENMGNPDLEKKIQILRYIVDVKLSEQKAAERAAEKKAKKQQIMEIIAGKQNEALQNSSVEELQAMLEELDD